MDKPTLQQQLLSAADQAETQSGACADERMVSYYEGQRDAYRKAAALVDQWVQQRLTTAAGAGEVAHG